MILCRFSFLILFIPIVVGVNKTATKDISAHNNTVSSPNNLNLLHKEDNSTTKSFTLAAEGGNIQVPQSNSTLLKDDAVQLPKLPSGDLGEISTKNKGKHVVGRTGAPVIDLKDSSVKATIVESKDISSKATVPIQKSTVINKVSASTNSSMQPPSPSRIPHKPTVLTYEEGSSIIADRVPPGASEATQATKPGSHPGMIMPVVITVLVVPLFAVLGYMALKRGQEAWKNRHYKRMDFLLDGMYND